METLEAQRIAGEQKVGDAFDVISRVINGGMGIGVNALTTVVANEHPTLSGQFAKAVAIGIVQRATYNPDWKPFGTWERTCYIDRTVSHPEHDGRHSCALVMGAVLMAQQYYV